MLERVRRCECVRLESLPRFEICRDGDACFPMSSRRNQGGQNLGLQALLHEGTKG